MPFGLFVHAKGFKNATWNFSEAGHGKGTPDNVRATLKRTADQLVAHGIDIPHSTALCDQLQNTGTSVKHFRLPAETINEAKYEETSLNRLLPNVPGILRIHQVATSVPGQLLCFDVSCMCMNSRSCKCHSKKVQFNLHKLKPNSQPVKRKLSIRSTTNTTPVKNKRKTKQDNSEECVLK